MNFDFNFLTVIHVIKQENIMESNSFTIKMPKPRNPLVEHARFRQAGSHVKTEKANRIKEKSKLKKWSGYEHL
jgi:hypothetical protein